MEQKVLAACLASREAYNTVAAHTDVSTLSIEGQELFHLAEEYYDNDPKALSVDRDILSNRIEGRFSNPKHAQKFKQILASLPEDVSVENIRKDIVALRRHQIGEKLQAALSLDPDGDDAVKYMDRFLKLAEEEDAPEEEILQGVDFKSLFEDHLNPEKLIALSPPPLNNACDGGAMPGHHLLIYGQSDMGKSLLALYMACMWAKKGKKVLFLENEEPLEFTIVRVGSCLTGLTKNEIRQDVDRAFELAVENGYDNILLKNVNPGTPREIENIVRRYEPDILIYNQLRNMKVRGDTRVNQLEIAATEMRRIAKQYEILAVSVTQAADSASGKLILDQGDVDSSNVGIPGQCDLMIGIGADKEYLSKGQRMISLAKNKLSPVQGGHFPVKFNTVLTRVEKV